MEEFTPEMARKAVDSILRARGLDVPERRLIRFYDSAQGQMRGTFPPTTYGLKSTDTASRQCKRAAWRAHNFTEITKAAYTLPRRERRRLAREIQHEIV